MRAAVCRAYGPPDAVEIGDMPVFWALDHSPEPREGMRAFMEKRLPSWVPRTDGGTQ